MPVVFEYVQEEAQPPRSLPSDLASFGIHPLFRREAFRYADYSHYLSLEELDEDTYDLSQIMYDRMKPALRLATLFMRCLMPELARIGYAPVTDVMLPGGYRVRTLADSWDYPTDVTEHFERNNLMQMCSHYRFTVLTGAIARSLCDAHAELAGTCALINHHPEASVDRTFPQTALSSSWLWFLARDDWETISTEEKYAKYLIFAATLLHELAHAVWIDRVLSCFDCKGVQNGELAVAIPEPRYYPSHLFTELGCAIEIELFHGLLAFPHFGTPTTTERDSREKPHRVLLTILDVEGRAMDIHQMSTKTIYSFFDPRRWAPLEDGDSPDCVIQLLENPRPPRRRMSTSLSDPRFLKEFNVPALSMPYPGMLKPAITADNELFD